VNGYIQASLSHQKATHYLLLGDTMNILFALNTIYGFFFITWVSYSDIFRLLLYILSDFLKTEILLHNIHAFNTTELYNHLKVVKMGLGM
jgi:hypothetical protein